MSDGVQNQKTELNPKEVENEINRLYSGEDPEPEGNQDGGQETEGNVPDDSEDGESGDTDEGTDDDSQSQGGKPDYSGKSVEELLGIIDGLSKERDKVKFRSADREVLESKINALEEKLEKATKKPETQEETLETASSERLVQAKGYWDDIRMKAVRDGDDDTYTKATANIRQIDTQMPKTLRREMSDSNKGESFQAKAEAGRTSTEEFLREKMPDLFTPGSAVHKAVSEELNKPDRNEYYRSLGSEDQAVKIALSTVLLEKPELLGQKKPVKRGKLYNEIDKGFEKALNKGGVKSKGGSAAIPWHQRSPKEVEDKLQRMEQGESFFEE